MTHSSSLSRIREAVGLRKPDVVPVAPYIGNHAAYLAGIPIGRYCTVGESMAQAQYHAWEIYQHDILAAVSDTYYIAEGFGLKVDHHDQRTPTCQTPLVQNWKDVYRLRVPNPHTDGRMPVYLDAIRRLTGRLDGRAAVRAPGTGPFALAGHLMGPEALLTELALVDREPAVEIEHALRRLMELTTGALIAFAKASVEAGAQIVINGDSLASPDVISPTMYHKWVFPFEKQFFAEINPHARKHGAMTLLHICGDTTPILEGMADTGADILELDSKVDLKRAKAQVGHKVCLMGNLNPVPLLLDGSVDEVTQAAADAIRDAAQGGGFILGSGCEVPVRTPRENLQAMIRWAREHRSSLA